MVSALLIPFVLSVNIVFAQPSSLIEDIQQVQSSFVSIHTEISSYSPIPPTRTVMNPETGQMVVVRNLARVAFRRGGAGVIVHKSGIIVTNAHIIDKASSVTVLFHDGSRAKAQILRVVGNVDIALLRVKPPHPLVAISVSDSDLIALGDEVIHVGNSALLERTISGGIITGLGTSRTVRKNGKRRTDLIHTSFNVYRGDSGGPLLNSEGQLIGLMTAAELGADHSSFAIPVNKITKYLKSYLDLPAGYR